VLFCASGLVQAESGSARAVIPWDGEGRVFQVGPSSVLFLGAFEGIIYVETASGSMDEGFVRCPAVQELDIAVTLVLLTVEPAWAGVSCFTSRPGHLGGDTPMNTKSGRACVVVLFLSTACVAHAQTLDRRENRADRRENVHDRNEQRRDRREDVVDSKTVTGPRDAVEDVADKTEDVRDRRENRADRKENRRDRKH
jgi:UDP-N-acetylenolpyruvoylglucosamine reductase